MGQLAVVIVPPAGDMDRVEDVRRRFDSLADAVPAHVTLVFPFEHGTADAALVNHVEEAARGVVAFDLELRAVTCSLDYFLFLLVDKGGDQVRDLHDRLYSGLLGPLLPDRAFTPHVTLGRFASADECAAAMRAVKPMNLQVRTRAASLRIYDAIHVPYRVISEIHLAEAGRDS